VLANSKKWKDKFILILVFPLVKFLSLSHSVQTGFEPHLASYLMGTGDSFPGSKAAMALHSPPTSTEVKNGGAIPPLPHISSWHSA
jgi:hypothetical protein